MYKIVCKKELNSAVTYMEIEAPFVARKAKAGQFIIFRVDEKSERVPLTIAGYDREKGTVAIIFQKVGLSTEMLGSLNEGDYIQDFVGPLGKPTDVEGKKRVCVVGGGVGCAIAYPSAKAFKEAGVETDVIVGFRNKDIVILEDEFKQACDHLYLMTDDGSYGELLHGMSRQCPAVPHHSRSPSPIGPPRPRAAPQRFQAANRSFRPKNCVKSLFPP